MTTYSESETFKLPQTSSTRSSSWLKAGIIAAASVLAGGLAAAWWNRKTLKILRQTGEMNQNPQYGIQMDDLANR
ncbi:MAG: hypothetical protein WA802_05265 [Terracidiphilus sp.]